MAFSSLADFLEQLIASGELVRASAAVDAELEIAAITRRVAREGGPALLFDQVRGHSVAVVTNLLGTETRLCRALQIESLSELTSRLRQLLQQSGSANWFDRLKLAPDTAATDRFRPRIAKNGPCQQVVRLGRDIKLSTLPALKSWPRETGRAIGPAPLVVQDPTGRQHSIGLYRCQILDDTRLALFDDGQGILARHEGDYFSQNLPLPVAMVLGGDPALSVSASLPAPADVDGFTLAGLLCGKPFELVKCRTQPLEVPSSADFVIEGQIEPGSQSSPVVAAALDTGHYSLPSPAAVITVSAITQRANAIFTATMYGDTLGENGVLHRVREQILRPVVQAAVPEMVDCALPAWGGSWRYAVISIRKTYPQQARRVASAVWGLLPLESVKFLVVVDAEVDVHDREQWLSALGANVHPVRDVFFHTGPAQLTDHATPNRLSGSAVGIDATAKLPAEHGGLWPERLTTSSEIEELVARRWPELGLSK